MKTLLTLTSAFFLSACVTHPDDYAVVHKANVLTPDGMNIVYDVRGRGDTTLLFIHCWAGDRSFWHRELVRFAGRYRVVSLDLPGHGESGDAREKWTVKGLAKDVETIANTLDLRRVILIGHSMGGPIALEVARLMPGRVIGVIGVDTLHDADIVFPRETAEQFAKAFEADYDGAMMNAIQSMLPPDVDAEAKAWIIDRACKAHHAPTIALMRDFPNVDLKELLSNAKVPVRCINKAPFSADDVSTAVEKNRAYADFDVVILQGVGHYPMIERPAEFDASLEMVVAALSGQ